MAINNEKRKRLLLLEQEKRKRQQQTQQQPTLLQRAGDAAVDITEKGREVLRPIGQKLEPAAQAAGQAVESLSPLQKAPIKLLGAGLDAFEKGGEALSETLAGPGLTVKPIAGIPGLPRTLAPAEEGEDAIKTSPEVAALIGTGFQMTPEIVGTLAQPGVLPAFKSVFSRQGAKQAGGFLKALAKRKPKATILTPEEIDAQAIKRSRQVRKGAATRRAPQERELQQLEESQRKLPAVEKAEKAELAGRRQRTVDEFGKLRREVEQPFEERVGRLQEAKKTSEARITGREKTLKEAKTKTGQEIGQREKDLGISLEGKDASRLESQVGKGSPRAFKKAKKLQELINKGPEYIADNMKPKNIQFNRKLFENVKEGALTGPGRQALRNAKDTFAKAVRLIDDKLDESLSKFNKIDKELQTLKTRKNLSQKIVNEKLQKAKVELADLKKNIETPATIKKLDAQLKDLPTDAAARRSAVQQRIDKVKKIIAESKAKESETLKRVRESKTFKRARTEKTAGKGVKGFVRGAIKNAIMRALIIKTVR